LLTADEMRELLEVKKLFGATDPRQDAVAAVETARRHPFLHDLLS
jgi:hypothetical protein